MFGTCTFIGVDKLAPFLTGSTPEKNSPDLRQSQEHTPAKVGWTGHVHFNPPGGDAALGPTYFRISGGFGFIPAAHFWIQQWKKDMKIGPHLSKLS